MRPSSPFPVPVPFPPDPAESPVATPHGRPPTGTRARGFSMVELVVTLFVLSALAAFAVPSITGVVNGSRLTGNANELLVGLQFARSEALRRNLRTTLCASIDGATCSNVVPWRGWVVFVDVDNDGVVDVGELVRRGNIEAPLQVRPSAAINNNRVTFRSDGLAYAVNNTLLRANIRVCLGLANPPQNARDVNIAIGGRPTVRAAANVGINCPAPGDL